MGARELLELQSLDDRLAQLGAAIARLEGEIAGSPELDRARARLAAAAAAREAAGGRVAEADAAASALRARARTLEGQLYGGRVRNPAELLTLQRELDDARSRLGGDEDAELELMAAEEAAVAEEAQAHAALAAIEAHRRDQAGPDAVRLEALRSDLADAAAERELVAARRSPAERALYARVAARHRPAVVRLAGDACGGCRVPLGIREVRAVRGENELVQCSSCDRILAP